MSYENTDKKMYRYKVSYVDNNGNIKTEKKDFKHGVSSFPKNWLYGRLMSLGMNPVESQQVAYMLACQCLPGNKLIPTYQVLFCNNIIKVEARQV